MILIAYDGSADSDAAVDRTAALMPGSQTTVLTVWRPLARSLEYHGGLAGAFTYSGPLGRGPQDLDLEAWDRELEQAAHAKAAEGAKRATSAGLQATEQVVKQRTSVADAIIDAADAVGASAIVLGSRGLTGARTWFLGSVSHTVLQHAECPVMIIPSEEVAAKRADHRRRTTDAD